MADQTAHGKREPCARPPSSSHQDMSRPTTAKEPLRIAALTLFTERGIHATSIRDIAKAARVSEAALYRHWPGKDALVLSLYREHLDEVTHLLDAAIQERPMDQAVRAATTAAFALYDREPLVFRFVLQVQHGIAELLPPGVRTPHDAVIDLVRAAVARGEAAGDPVVLGGMLTGLFLQVATFVQYGRLSGPLASHTDTVIAAALRLLQVPGGKSRAK
jgi:AcrR family transcriptional regulator